MTCHPSPLALSRRSNYSEALHWLVHSILRQAPAASTVLGNLDRVTPNRYALHCIALHLIVVNRLTIAPPSLRSHHRLQLDPSALIPPQLVSDY